MIVFVCHNFKRMDVYEGSTKPNFLYSSLPSSVAYRSIEETPFCLASFMISPITCEAMPLRLNSG